jgi:flagellar hook-associated protein 3 FlgL
MTQRIPDISMLSTMQDTIAKNQNDYSELQIKIAQGKKYLKRSEDTIATNEAAVINIDITQSEKWKTNIDTVVSWEQTTEGALDTILDNMQRVNELIIQGNSTVNAEEYDNIAAELNEIIEALVDLGNSKYLGTSIFAGKSTQEGVDPFVGTDTNADGMIDQVVFNGGVATEQREIATSDTATASYGVVGGLDYDNSLFDFKSYEETSPGVWADVNVSSFETLIQVRDDLLSATGISDQLFQRAQRAVDNVVDRVVDNSASQKKMESLGQNITSAISVSTNRLSEVEDLDVAAAATNLASVESTLEASLQMAARLNQLSIINYI